MRKETKKKHDLVARLALSNPEMKLSEMKLITGISESQMAVYLARYGIKKEKGIGGRIGGRWKQTNIYEDRDLYTPIPKELRKPRGRPADPNSLSRQVEYKIHQTMKARCTNPNFTNYHNYGGRGITVCERWLGNDGFKNFYQDMGKRPEGRTGNRPKYTLERRDNNLGYSKENCYWATWEQQNNNSREKSFGGKLTFLMAQEIRNLVKSGVSKEEITQKYNIQYDYISQIINNKVWNPEIYSDQFLSSK